MLRIVFDTNIYISAALRGAQAEAIFQLAALGKITLITSPAILGELAEKLTDKFNWDEEQVTFFVETIEDVAEVVEPQLTLHVVEEDEDDNRILECAIEGEAGLIVTYDRDLLRLKAYENVGIVTPVDLLHFGLVVHYSENDRCHSEPKRSGGEESPTSIKRRDSSAFGPSG